VKTGLVISFAILSVTLPILGIVMAGRWLSRRVVAKDPGSELVRPLAKTGIALNACLVVMLLLGLCARQLAPESPLGAFLVTPRGVIAGLVALCIGFAVAQAAFRACGYPIRHR
jgi:hypothetical protein